MNSFEPLEQLQALSACTIHRSFVTKFATDDRCPETAMLTRYAFYLADPIGF